MRARRRSGLRWQSGVHGAIRSGFQASQSLTHGTRITIDEVIASVLANREMFWWRSAR